MSSAALQSTPHQTAASVAGLNPSPLVAASPSSRHHNQSTSSPGRDPYYATSQHGNSPSGSRRPTSRKESGTASGKGDVPSQSNSPMSSRTAVASPVPVNTSSDQYKQPSSDRRKNMPTTVPPRISSQQAPGTPGGGSNSRRSAAQGHERSNSQRYAGNDANGQAGASQAYQEEAAAQSSRNRRSAYTGQEQTPKSSSGHRDTRAAGSSNSATVRNQQGASSTPQGPSREASEILNSMLVSQPEVDIERERERIALAQPHQTPTFDGDAIPPSIPTTADQHGEETRRGGRSRHDFSKREKHTKFGEYILGNTIGEGEFGKVKLGWKQEGGIQVRRHPKTYLRRNTDIIFFACRSLSNSSRKTSSAATRLVWPRSCVKSLSSNS